MIKNVLFDVGGVLIGYRWQDMLRDYGQPEKDLPEIGDIIFGDPYWRRLDKGEVSLAETTKHFVETYPKYSQCLEYFFTHAELMAVDRPRVWEKMKELKAKGYKIYLLSNYSDELFDIHVRTREFIDYPDGMVVSYEAHVCKPDPLIYQIMVDRYNLKKEECIFFDDLIENVTTAKEFGFSSVQITSEEVLLEEIEKLLNQ